jgi:Golgi apparatus protein 1
VFSSGVFELSLEKFSNDLGVNSEGNCCSGIRERGMCRETCRTFFRVCLNHYQSTISENPKCTFGEVTTPIVGNNSFKLTDTSQGFSNPIQLPFDFSWPVSTSSANQ